MRSGNKVTCLIVDNDQQTNKQLEVEIKRLADDLELLGIQTDATNGYARAMMMRADVIFLNITFPWFTGLDVLGNAPVRGSRIIFLAKEANYVHQSLKGGKFDCLLKPFSQTELRRTLKRLKEEQRFSNPTTFQSASAGVAQYKFNKLSLPTTKGNIFLDPRDIIYCQADQEYIRLVTVFETHLISKNLKYFETRLDSRRFFRVHKSYVLNLEHMESYVRSEGGHVIMSDHKVIHIGRSRKNEFAALMGV